MFVQMVNIGRLNSLSVQFQKNTIKGLIFDVDWTYYIFFLLQHIAKIYIRFKLIVVLDSVSRLHKIQKQS